MTYEQAKKLCDKYTSIEGSQHYVIATCQGCGKYDIICKELVYLYKDKILYPVVGRSGTDATDQLRQDNENGRYELDAD